MIFIETQYQTQYNKRLALLETFNTKCYYQKLCKYWVIISMKYKNLY